MSPFMWMPAAALPQTLLPRMTGRSALLEK
jgi:hypothetical protein